MRRRCSGVGPDLLLGERRRVAEGAVRRRRYWWAVGEKGGSVRAGKDECGGFLLVGAATCSHLLPLAGFPLARRLQRVRTHLRDPKWGAMPQAANGRRAALGPSPSPPRSDWAGMQTTRPQWV